jgi:hypothetical protein
MSKDAFDYGAWMLNRGYKIRPIETKKSIFVKWWVHGGI